MSYGFKIMVKGDYAAFNRPEMKVEHLSMFAVMRLRKK